MEEGAESSQEVEQKGQKSGTMVYRVTVCFARRKEFLSASNFYTVSRIALVCAPKFPSKMVWEDLWEVVLILCNSIRSLETNGRRS